MKSVLGNQTFTKCNFCLNWYNSAKGCDWSAITSLNICEGCFERGRRTACFRVVQPKSLSLFELQFRKCVSTEMYGLVQGQANELVELIDQYERDKNFAQLVEPLKGYLTELVDCENDILNRLEPVKEFVNKLYNMELGRIEKVWDSVLLELENVGVRITDYRKQVTQQLRTYSCEVATGQKVLNSIRSEIENSLQTYNLDKVRDRYRDCQAEFYLNGFKLGETLEKAKQRQPLTERTNTEVTIPVIERLELRSPRENSQDARKRAYGKQFKSIRDRVRGTKEEKENLQELPTESTSRSNLFQPIKSPRNQRIKSSVTQNPLKPSKRQRSVDSSGLSEEGKERDQTKSQILEILKRKSPTVNKAYPQRVMKETIYQALERTFEGASLLELVAYRTQNLEFFCYLEMLSWHEQLEVVKFVKIGLTDDHLAILLNFLNKSRKVETLVITNNLLTDSSLDILYSHFSVHRPIKNIYLGRNYIQPLRCKNRLHQLRDLGVNVYI